MPIYITCPLLLTLPLNLPLTIPSPYPSPCLSPCRPVALPSVVQCPPIVVPAHATLTACSDQTAFLSECTLHCLTHPSPCLSPCHPVALSSVVQCPPIVVPAHATLTACSDQTAFLSECTLHCETGYHFNSQDVSNTVICLETGQWNSEPKQCLSESTQSLLIISPVTECCHLVIGD